MDEGSANFATQQPARFIDEGAEIAHLPQRGKSGLTQKPFLKWAGGKRWLVDRPDFTLPPFTGRYIEPFLGGGAVFFSLLPRRALLSDANARLIEAYQVARDDWRSLVRVLGAHHKRHGREYYYRRRAATPATPLARAAQFIYLNRACWNGLYRVNLRGEFNVPIGTKDWIVSDSDDFEGVSRALESAELACCDFELAIDQARTGDLIFADPPYTVAHNFNGFVKYNENIFSWADQERLARALSRAAARGATVVSTNADHPTVRKLYAGFAQVASLSRASVISGITRGRQDTSELLITTS